MGQMWGQGRLAPVMEMQWAKGWGTGSELMN